MQISYENRINKPIYAIKKLINSTFDQINKTDLLLKMQNASRPQKKLSLGSPPSLIFTQYNNTQKNHQTKMNRADSHLLEEKKESSLDYFQKLEGDLLSKSNRYASLIGNSLYKKLPISGKGRKNNLSQYSAQRKKSENQSLNKYRNMGLTDQGFRSMNEFRLSKKKKQSCYSSSGCCKEIIQEHLSLENLHKQRQRHYEKGKQVYQEADLQSDEKNQNFGVGIKSSRRQKTQRRSERSLTEVSENPTLASNKTKQNYSQRLKSILEVVNKNKQKNHVGIETNRKLVYNLTFQDSDPSILEDSPEKVVRFIDQQQKGEGYNVSLDQTIKRTKPCDSAVLIKNIAPKSSKNSIGGCLKTRKNSRFGACENLMQTASTEVSNGVNPKLVFKNPSAEKKKVNVSQEALVAPKSEKRLQGVHVLQSKNTKRSSHNEQKQHQQNVPLTLLQKSPPNNIGSVVRFSQEKKLKQKPTSFNSSIHIQDFSIIDSLGKGKVGSVYIAKHKQSGFLCALKVISKQIINQHFATQLIRQIKIQLFLDHPNIVQLYTYFSDSENIYLVIELCCSGNLYSYLRKQTILSQSEIKSIIRQVCYAVEYMHDNDILHRDIKPENILFHEKVIKICDFGWSVYSPLMRDTQCGTPIYASPEIVEKKQYSNKIDVWNIGILTYELLCGRVPFEIRSQADLYKVVKFQSIISTLQVIDEIHFPQSIHVSENCKQFIRRCLCKNPEKRYSIAQLLKHQFLKGTD